MQYVPIRRRSREQILANLSSGSPEEIAAALLSAAYWDSDWRWAQQQLFRFAGRDDDQILWAVATGLGFIAAFHGELDEREAQLVLNRLKARPGVANAAEETTADIEHFVKKRREGQDVDLAERLPEDWSPPQGHFKNNQDRS
jgi:hypothetical protein